MTAPTQAPPEAAAAFYTTGQQITAAILLAVRQLWPSFDPLNIDVSFARILIDLASVIASGQAAAARSATTYVPTVLDELGMKNGRPAGVVQPSAFVGSSSGLTLPETLDTVRLRALQTASQGGDAAAGGLALLEGIVRTQVADAARLATSTEIAVRPWLIGYVRMINPPACDRCVVLAGKFYLHSDGFKRHENCDCRHIPADEDTADNLRTDPNAYFRSLSESEQNATFGKAKAEALRLGADMSQVVNTRGVRTAQIYGRRVRVTSAGTSSRGTFGRQQRDLAKVSGQRYRRSRTPRLTPESILKLAKDRDDAIRLLERYAYITTDLRAEVDAANAAARRGREAYAASRAARGMLPS